MRFCPILSLCIVVSLSFFACGSGDKTCALGAPQAIFSEEMDIVNQHSFEARGQESTERFVVDDSLSVEIQQSGCDKVRQIFIFDLKGDYTNPTNNWVEFAADLLYDLGAAGPEIAIYFDPLSAQIGQEAAKISLGEPYALGDGRSVIITKVVAANHSQVSVEIMNE